MIEKTKGIANYLYNHHFVRYLFVGGTTFAIDFSLLFVLHAKLNVNLAVATSIAYWFSIIYNFCLNRWWTFSASENQRLHKHIALYSTLLGFNYLFTVLFVSIASHFIYFGAAKILAVALQIVWTYPTYKNVIFVKTEHKSTSEDTTVTTSKV